MQRLVNDLLDQCLGLFGAFATARRILLETRYARFILGAEQNAPFPVGEIVIDLGV